MLRTGLSFKRALNDHIRVSGPTPARAAEPSRMPTFDMGEPLADLDRAHALAADLEDDSSFDRVVDALTGVRRLTPGAS